MNNIEELINKIKHGLFITVPKQLWYQLYRQLEDYCLAIANDREATLIAETNYYQITVTNLKHQPLITIPSELEYLSDVNFTNRFNKLPINQQEHFKSLIQQTIDKAKELRKKA